MNTNTVRRARRQPQIRRYENARGEELTAGQIADRMIASRSRHITRSRTLVLDQIATAGIATWRWSERKRQEFLQDGWIRVVPHTGGRYEITAAGIGYLIGGKHYHGIE